MFTDFSEYDFESTRINSDFSYLNPDYCCDVPGPVTVTDIQNETLNENSPENEYAFLPNNSISEYVIPEQNNPLHNIYFIQQENSNLKIASCLGRKRKDCLTEGPHNKYCEDNMIRKTKIIIKDSLLKHINSQIKPELNLSVLIDGKEYKDCKILNIRQDNLIYLDANEDKNILHKKWRDIFSDDISGKFHNFPKNYNKIIIDKLYEMDNTENVTKILDMTFLESIQFFRKDSNIFYDKNYSCLKGLEKKFENLKHSLQKKNHEEDYIDKLINLIKNFENILEKKIPRVKRPKKVGRKA